MTIKILTCYPSGKGWNYLVEDTDTGRKITLNNEASSGKDNPRPTDVQIIAQAQTYFNMAESLAVEPVLSAISLSDAELIAEVKKRPQITAKELGLSIATVEEIEP